MRGRPGWIRKRSPITETGKTNPDSSALIKLADFFGVSIDYLVGRSGGAPKKDIASRLDAIVQSIEDVKKLL